MRGVDDDHPGPGCRQGAQIVQVEAEPTVIAERPERDVAADRFGDTVELLVGRIDDHDPIPRRKELVEEQEIRFDGAGGHENFVGRGVLVGGREQATQLRAATRFAVSQPQIE